MTATLNLSWPDLIGAVVLVLVLGLLGIVALSRDPRRHRMRVGFFVERDDQELAAEQPPAADDEPPPES